VVPPGTAGAIRIDGTVYDGEGAGVPDAMIEIYQEGGFGRLFTDHAGNFHVVTVKPRPMPARDGRQQAPHLDVLIFARGLLRQLATRLYFPDEATANAADPVLGALEPRAASTLVARLEGATLRFDVHLQGDQETVFFVV